MNAPKLIKKVISICKENQYCRTCLFYDDGTDETKWGDNGCMFERPPEEWDYNKISEAIENL